MKTSNMTIVIEALKLLDKTKDSLHIEWDIDNDFGASIQNYQVRYQAVGSTVVQRSELLKASRMDHIIAPLHESTEYTICVEVKHNLTSFVTSPCINASTSIDSLHVALGSTFGAFLALGVIIFFVFVAKWNYKRKLMKQLRGHVPPEELENPDKRDGELEMSEVSLNVNEDTLTHQDSTNSQASGLNKQTNGSVTQRESFENDIEEEIEGAVGGATDLSPQGSTELQPTDLDLSARTSLINKAPQRSHHPLRSKRAAAREYMKLPQNSMSLAETANPPKSCMDAQKTASNKAHDYGGARPKEYSILQKMNKQYPSTSTGDPQHPKETLRPNLSW